MIVTPHRGSLAVVLVVIAAVGSCVGSSSEADRYNDGYYGGMHGHRIHYFDILMDRPFGAPPPAPVCSALTEPCESNEDCCDESGNEQCNVGGNKQCCLVAGTPCNPATDAALCCDGGCGFDSNLNYVACNPVCFAGDTKVLVQDASRRGFQAVAMRDVQTGQFVQCLNSTDDMRLPTTLTICEVKNWAHAEDTPSVRHVRIAFTKPSGGQGSLTMSPTHMMFKLTAAAVGDEATNMEQFGAFSLVQAQALRPGDRMVVLKDEANPSAGFKVVAVVSADFVKADGYYVPAIGRGYLIADGAVAPRSIDFRVPMVGIEGLDGVKQAATLYTSAPVWMTRNQSLGTPGSNASWNGSPLWPGLSQIAAANRPHLQAGESLNYPALRAWFLPRFAEWLSNGASAAITLEEVVSVLRSDAVWVKPSRAARSARGSKPQKEQGWLVGARPL